MPKGKFEQFRGEFTQEGFDEIISRTRAHPDTVEKLQRFFVNGDRQRDITDKKQTFSNRLRWFLEISGDIEKL